MSDTAAAQAKDSGFSSAIKTPWGAALELVKRFGLAVVLLIVLGWRFDQQIVETREQNKALVEAAIANSAKLAVIVEQSTVQSKQTQQAIEKFTESIGQQQRSMERVLDRVERNSSAIQFRGPVAPKAPVIE